MINWDEVSTTTTDMAFNVVKKFQEDGFTIPNEDYTGLVMDLEAASLVVEIDWDGLLNASHGDLGHDVYGIYKHLNRETGELDDGFVPRHSITKEEVSHAQNK